MVLYYPCLCNELEVIEDMQGFGLLWPIHAAPSKSYLGVCFPEAQKEKFASTPEVGPWQEWSGRKKNAWSTSNVLLTHLSLCVTFQITFSGRLWLQLLEQWVVQWLVQCPKGRQFKSHVEVSLGKALNSKLLPMGLAKGSAPQVQPIYHLAQMDAHDPSEGLGKSFIRRAGPSEVLLRGGTRLRVGGRRENFYFCGCSSSSSRSSGTVTLFHRAECLCIDLADRENGEIFHMLYQGHRGINSLRPASSVLFSSRPRRHRL